MNYNKHNVKEVTNRRIRINLLSLSDDSSHNAVLQLEKCAVVSTCRPTPGG